MNITTSIRTESLNTVVTVAHAITNNVITIEGVPFNEFFATRQLNAELLLGLGELTKSLKKMGPAASAAIDANIAENLYPVFDAICAGKL